MNCRRSEELWSDFLEKALAPPIERELRSHLASCEACGELFPLFEEVVRALPTLRTPSPPTDLTERIVGVTRPSLERRREKADRLVLPLPTGWAGVAGWIAAAAIFALAMLWHPPDFLADWSRQVSQTAHRAYSFGVRTYHHTERWIEELNVLRMTVGVAFEDRLDRLSQRLRDLEEARRRTSDENDETSSRHEGQDRTASEPMFHEIRSLL